MNFSKIRYTRAFAIPTTPTDDPQVAGFKALARSLDRPYSELIRDALDQPPRERRGEHVEGGASAHAQMPLSSPAKSAGFRCRK